MSGRRGIGAIVPALLVGLLSFAITVEWRAQTASSHAVEGRRGELAAAVTARQAHGAELERRLADLRAEIASLAAATGGTSLMQMRALTQALAVAAGTTQVTGPGLTVTLADAPPSDRTANSADSRVQDVDIQAIINALWNAGAEAISVNGERIVATTAVRNAGQAVLVNYHVLSSPYVVSSIGGPTMATSFQASGVARRFRGWEEIYGLGFHVETKGSIVLPAFGGSLRLRYAQAVPQG